MIVEADLLTVAAEIHDADMHVRTIEMAHLSGIGRSTAVFRIFSAERAREDWVNALRHVTGISVE